MACKAVNKMRLLLIPGLNAPHCGGLRSRQLVYHPVSTHRSAHSIMASTKNCQQLDNPGRQNNAANNIHHHHARFSGIYRSSTQCKFVEPHSNRLIRPWTTFCSSSSTSKRVVPAAAAAACHACKQTACHPPPRQAHWQLNTPESKAYCNCDAQQGRGLDMESKAENKAEHK